MSESVNEKELQKERKEIIARILEIQKKFMDLERKKGVTEKDIQIFSTIQKWRQNCSTRFR